MDFLKLLGYQLPADTLIFFIKKKKKLVDIAGPLKKYTYQTFIIMLSLTNYGQIKVHK
jgi:hypothetical protein